MWCPELYTVFSMCFLLRHYDIGNFNRMAFSGFCFADSSCALGQLPLQKAKAWHCCFWDSHGMPIGSTCSCVHLAADDHCVFTENIPAVTSSGQEFFHGLFEQTGIVKTMFWSLLVQLKINWNLPWFIHNEKLWLVLKVSECIAGAFVS